MMGTGPSDDDGHNGNEEHGERPLPKLEPYPTLIGKTLVGSGAPEPKQRGRRREKRLGRWGRA